MQRRALLASLGTLVSGCVRSPGASSGTTSTPTTGTPDSCETVTDRSNGEYEVTDLRTSTSTDRPEVRYVLEPSAFYSKDAVGREEERTGEEQVVVDVDDVERPQVRSAIETAIQDGEWKADVVPDGLAETVDRVDFFTGVSEDNTHTHIGLVLHELSPGEPPAVTFSADIDDETVSSDSPGVLVFALENRSSEPQEVDSGTVPPFGMLRADSPACGEFLLWREYEAEGCFSRTDNGWARCDIGVLTMVEPGERVSRRYEILPGTTTQYPNETVPPAAGTYQVTDSVGYSPGTGAPGSTLSFDVEFTLEML